MSHYIRQVLLLSLILLLGYASADAARKRTRRTPARTEHKSTAPAERTAGSVRSERSRTQKEIAETRTRITRTQQQTRRSLEQLEGLNAGIRRQENRIGALNSRIDSLNGAISAVADTITVLETQVDGLREGLKETLRSMRQRRKSVNDVAFVFSAPSFDAARRRVSYLDQLNGWRTRKIGRLRARSAVLKERRLHLQGLRHSQASALSELSASRQTLVQQKQKQQQVVDELRGETASLNRILGEKQKRVRELDRELDRIIAEEQRRREAEERARAKARAEAEARAKAARDKERKSGGETAAKSSEPEKSGTASSASAPAGQPATAVADADRALSGTFAANKGRLLFPVAGRYSVVGTFGRTEHQKISNVQVNNSGIDIAVSPGTKARAVFDGTVSSVFFMPGYSNIVIIRHGQYLTVYAGLTALSVRKGATVKAGAAIGTVQPDDDDPSRAVLHFEVRHEREKLNPLDWVR